MRPFALLLAMLPACVIDVRGLDEGRPETVDAATDAHVESTPDTLDAGLGFDVLVNATCGCACYDACAEKK